MATYVARLKFRVRTIWLLSLFSAWTLLFFSISTNQEYYTFPVWTPLFILIAGVVAGIEENRTANGAPDRVKPSNVSAIRPWMKLMMMCEEAISLIVALLVVARAVNILK